MGDVINIRPWSPEQPCIVCGAGMSHAPDGHTDWCSEQAALNASINRHPAT